jgi:hypothetical protein
MNECAEYEECQYEQGSPCTSAGLHMPNSQSLMNFTRKVRSRLRYNSLCSPYPVLDSSNKMRRISSCPNIKRLDEKDENQPLDNNVSPIKYLIC